MPANGLFSGTLEWLFVALLAIPLAFFAACVLRLWLLTLAAVGGRNQLAELSPQAGTPIPSSATERVASDAPRFAVLIPAHNEELLISAVLESLSGLDYPKSAYRVVVIADNCTDRTAEIARSKGAVALERFNKTLIGKGYALEWALERLFAAQNEPDSPLGDIANFDAVVILDADTLVSPNLLTAFAAGLHAGQQAMQARYEVLNLEESWRTRLMGCALALAHIVKPLGRERLGLSDGLKGNGMCFSRQVVEQVPWSGESITEDIEYTLRLCRAGHRIAFLPGAAVWAQMPTTGAQAASQRQRWEGGRYRLLFQVAPNLLWEGIRRRSGILRDRAYELIIPPFAEMFAVPVALGAVCAVVAFALGWRGAWILTLAWGGVVALQAGYLFGGLWVAKVPTRIALSVLGAPFYILWKFGLYAVMAFGRSTGGWKRTERRELQ